MKLINIGFKDKILNVGCGKGILLYNMKQSGFSNVWGVDSFIKETIRYKNGLKIIKGELSEIKEKFDLIMFNHSLEHMRNQFEILKRTHTLLNDGKYLLIRIPVCVSHAFNHYKYNWCSLDAPRQLFLHTKKSIQFLTDKFGF